VDCYLSALVNPAGEVEFGKKYVWLAPTVPEILGKTAEPTKEELTTASAKLMEYVTKLPAIGTPSRVESAPFKEFVQRNSFFWWRRRTPSSLLARSEASASHLPSTQRILPR
jgi:hypothetical protein